MSRLEMPAPRPCLNEDALEVIFRSARTYNGWLDKPVSDETISEIYDLMKWGRRAPTRVQPGSFSCGQ